MRITMLFFTCLLFCGCPLFDDSGSVTLIVKNNASADVVDLLTGSYSDDELRTIPPGGDAIIKYDWPEGGKNGWVSFGFMMNGLEYGAVGGAKAQENPQRYKPDKRVKDGETVTVNIYDDHWEW